MKLIISRGLFRKFKESNDVEGAPQQDLAKHRQRFD